MGLRHRVSKAKSSAAPQLPTPRYARQVRKLSTILMMGLLSSFACGKGDSGGDDGPGSTSGTDDATSTDSETDASTTEAESTDDGGPPKLDVGGALDIPMDCQGGDFEELEFSNLWVANTNDGTVSKVDTLTVEEIALYDVFPDGIDGGWPSRTSVNLNGDMVVANRCDKGGDPVAEGCGGVTMIVAREEDCEDRNNDNQITTSQGAGDLLGWMEDECVIWHTPITQRSNRPVAWTSGDFDEQACRWSNAKVWTASSNGADATTGLVYLLDGATGDIEETVTVEGWPGTDRAIYGGAVDSNNDFWFIGGYGNSLGRVFIDDFSYEVIDIPGQPYGVMVDAEDRPWVSGGSAFHRYDPDADNWDSGACTQTCVSITQDHDGFVWIAGGNNDGRALKVDPNMMSVVDKITVADLPDVSGPAWGISVDVENFLWLIETGGAPTKAFKIDTETYDYDFFDNPARMYTYSDMTGFGLANVADPAG